MQASTIILLGVIGIIMGVNYYIKNKDVVSVRSTIDGREYRIADSLDKQEAADLLGDMNRDIIKFVDYLRNNSDENVQRICNRYNPDKLGENLEYKSYKAYSRVHLVAFSLYFSKSVLYSFAISISNGSSTFGSVNNEQIDNSNFDIVNAGLHESFSISKHIPPLLLTFG